MITHTYVCVINRLNPQYGLSFIYNYVCTLWLDKFLPFDLRAYLKYYIYSNSKSEISYEQTLNDFVKEKSKKKITESKASKLWGVKTKEALKF